MSSAAALKAVVLEEARRLGFACAGIAPAETSPRAGRFQRFVELGLHAEMAYLGRDPAARADPRRLLAGAASVICLAVSYAPSDGDASAGLIARYARGRDYHRLLRVRCRKLLEVLSARAPALRGRICVDTAPVLERDLAASAGLGWIGRNGCLVNRRWGSYLLLAEIIVDVPLPPDEPVANGCGSCRRCLRACPTGAIREDGLVDSRRCIGYLTIEHRGNLPEELCSTIGRRVFGCDACQEVCPYNRAVPAGDGELRGPSALARTPLAELLAWDQADWDRLTRGSAARRATWEMFLRNAAVAAGNTGQAHLRPHLHRLAGHPAGEVARAARWALHQKP
ncbi:MAG: tRNA epoxyqueuosine(34) reductase QueG [Planctomycetales bacterium 4484_123]|nr:MAG: tRNA epoxyqueuosine(34) reductase QueG [Planctomycetales bacterium 4484_123]